MDGFFSLNSAVSPNAMQFFMQDWNSSRDKMRCRGACISSLFEACSPHTRALSCLEVVLQVSNVYKCSSSPTLLQWTTQLVWKLIFFFSSSLLPPKWNPNNFLESLFSNLFYLRTHFLIVYKRLRTFAGPQNVVSRQICWDWSCW